MSWDDVADIQISAETETVPQAGFGTPLILGRKAAFADDVVREYEDLAGLVSDGMTSGTPEYKAAAKLFGQSPRPSKVKVARRVTSSPQLHYTLTPVVKIGHTYTVEIDGEEYEYTSEEGDVAADIVAGLIAAINGAEETDEIVTASGSSTLELEADDYDVWFDLFASIDDFAIVCDHADEGESPGGSEAGASVADDLSDIVLVDNDWYGLVSVFKSEEEIEAIAEWVETQKKIFCAASPNTDIVGSGDEDVASSLESQEYARSWVFYHERPGQFADAAILGRCLPTTPGSETWKFKTLAGVTKSQITPTRRSNALGKNAMLYTNSMGFTEEGVTASGEFIDNTRFLDWVRARMQEGIVAMKLRQDKVPYTDAGAQGLGSVVQGVLDEGVRAGGFRAEPAPEVTVPLVASQSDAARAARRFEGITFSAQLAGAIHKTTVRGLVTV